MKSGDIPDSEGWVMVGGNVKPAPLFSRCLLGEGDLVVVDVRFLSLS